MTPQQIKDKNTELFQLYHETRLRQLKLIDEIKKNINEQKILRDCKYDFELILNDQKPWYEGLIKKEIQDLFKENDDLFNRLKK